MGCCAWPRSGPWRAWSGLLWAAAYESQAWASPTSWRTALSFAISTSVAFGVRADSLSPARLTHSSRMIAGFGDVHVKAVVESARHLTRINLGGTAISDVGLRHLLESECAARLEYVGLAGCSYLTSSSPQGGIVDLGTRCPALTGTRFPCSHAVRARAAVVDRLGCAWVGRVGPELLDAVERQDAVLHPRAMSQTGGHQPGQVREH
jgi:hypothetical protein